MDLENTTDAEGIDKLKGPKAFVSQSELSDRTGLETVQVAGLSRLRFHGGRRAYQINGEKHRYDFFLDAKDVRLPLVVFGQGAQDRGQVQLPRFQRMDWARALPYNVMIFNDPTLFCSDDLTLGWCVGTADHPVLPTHVEIILSAAKFLWIEPRNILFYGSSAGGFTSLMLSSMIQGSSALVNNPQTDVFRFTRGGVKRLLEVSFPSCSQQDLSKITRDRFSFVERVRMGDHIPNIYYLQNLLDGDHVVDQMNPLVSALQDRLSGCSGEGSPEIILDLYCDHKALHNPVGMSRVMECIKRVERWFHVT